MIGSAGCQSPPGRDLIDQAKREPHLYEAFTHEAYRERFLARGLAIVPEMVDEIDRADASGQDPGAANQIVFYLDVLRHFRAREAREAVERLLSRTQDENLQFDALRTLDVIGNHRSCAALRAALRSPHSDVRALSAAILDQFWCDEAVPDLIEQLDDPHENTARCAEDALVRLTGEWFHRDVDAWRAWLQTQARRPTAS